MSGRDGKRTDEGLMMMQELEDRLKEQIDKLEHIRLSATELKDSIAGNGADLKQSISDHLEFLSRLTERVETLQMNTAVFVQMNPKPRTWGGKQGSRRLARWGGRTWPMTRSPSSRERVERVKSIEEAMKVEKEQFERERERMENWAGRKREETARQTAALAEALNRIREQWDTVAEGLEGEMRREGERLEEQWVKVEEAMEREREGRVEEMRAQREQWEREQEYAERERRRMEERRTLERKVWEKERESLEEEVRRKGKQMERQWRKLREAMQEQDRAMEDLLGEIARLVKTERMLEENRGVTELLEREVMKLKIWGEIELMEAQRQKVEREMFMKVGEMEGEVRRLRKEMEEAMMAKGRVEEEMRREREEREKMEEVRNGEMEELVRAERKIRKADKRSRHWSLCCWRKQKED